MSDLPTSYSEAKRVGSMYYFTGKPCKRGHLVKRRTANATCVECSNHFVRKHYHDNIEEQCEKGRRYTKANPEKVRARKKRYREKPETQEKERAYARQWAKDNPALAAANASKRRAAHLQRTPPWADLELIDVFYGLAKDMEEVTGVKRHVDHIIPLRGSTVSGLHVATNLQIITAAENTRKSNTYDIENHPYRL